MDSFTVVEKILRNRQQFFAEIRDGLELRQKIRDMLLSSFAFLAVYGAVMGVNHSLFQALASFVKLPILFLATLIICAPSLYIFNLMFGSRQVLLQNIAFILTAMTTSSVLLLSFAPVTLFFLLTTTEYQFFKLLNIGFFVIAGSLGVLFLWQGFKLMESWDNPEGLTSRRWIFRMWAVLYAFVGSQMAWTLRPFMGIPERDFIFFEQRGGNFYADIIESIRVILGFQV